MEDEAFSRRHVLKGTAVAVASGGIAGCSEESGSPEASGAGKGPTESGSTPSTNGAGNATQEQRKVELLNHQSFEEEYQSGVRGKLKNTSGETLDYVEVSVRFYDDEGTRIGENFTNATDLAAGKTWQFEVLFLEDGSFADYKIEASLDAM